MCHKELKMSRRGLRSAPWQLLTTLYQSSGAFMTAKAHLKHRKWLIKLFLCWVRLEIRGEGSCATQDDSCSREGGNWFIYVPLVPLPHHGPHWGATEPQIQAEAQPCWGDQSMFWPKNTPSRKQNFPTRDVWRVCPAVRDLWSPA